MRNRNWNNALCRETCLCVSFQHFSAVIDGLVTGCHLNNFISTGMRHQNKIWPSTQRFQYWRLFFLPQKLLQPSLDSTERPRIVCKLKVATLSTVSSFTAQWEAVRWQIAWLFLFCFVLFLLLFLNKKVLFGFCGLLSIAAWKTSDFVVLW